MGVNNDRAASIARQCDELLETFLDKLRDPRIDRPDEAIFIGRIVTADVARVGTGDQDTGGGSAGYFCGTMAELSETLRSFDLVVNFQIVNLTNVAHELRRRCNEENIFYALLFEA
jgi:hypothetical protein